MQRLINLRRRARPLTPRQPLRSMVIFSIILPHPHHWLEDKAHAGDFYHSDV